MADLSQAVSDIISTKSRALIDEKIKNLLDPVKMPSIKDIPNLAIHDFRDLTVQEGTLIGELLNVKTIKDLSKVPYEQVFNRISLLREAGFPKKKLELLITASKFIVRAAEYKPIEGKKVVIAGLDNAGKSALIKTITKEVGLMDLSSLKPTKGASRDELFLGDQDLHVLELGGQEEFRKFYIEQPDRFFLDTDIIVYVMDIQDDTRFSEAFEYLDSILRVLAYLQVEEALEFIILLHKCDPDLLGLPIFQERVDYVTQQIKQMFGPYPYPFEIQTSSIYNIVSMTPSFSGMLKGLFSGGSLAEEQKIQAIGNLLMKMTNLFLDTESNLTRQISSVNQRITGLETQIRQMGKASTPAGDITAPPPPIPSHSAPPPQPKPSEPRGGLSTRSALLSELKQVFNLKGKIE